MITIPNERLLTVIDRNTSMLDAFLTADDVLRQAIQGISDLILVPGLINLDFADVKTIMSGMGVAMMGTASAEGPTRAIDAAKRAISSPLLEDTSVNGARGVIINVTGGSDMSLIEVNEALTIIQESAHEDAEIIFGAVVDDTLNGHVKITVIATGFDHVKADRVDSRRPRLRSTCRPTRRSCARPRAAARCRVSAHGDGAARHRRRVERTGRGWPLITRPATDSSSAWRRRSGEFDPNLELEVPAFLRRSEG